MRVLRLVTVFACVGILADVPQALAQSSCAFLGPDADLGDGNLYFRQASLGWTKFSWRNFEEARLKGRRYISFAYVVHTNADRAGVLVIKSARKADVATPGNVLLIRKRQEYAGSCKQPTPFAPNAVSSRAYDDYHDLTSKDSELRHRGEGTPFQTIKDFHIEYSRTCRRTDALENEDGQRERRSNRSQFSYDRTVVDDGHPYAIITALRRLFGNGFVRNAFGAEYNGSASYSEQRTEIRRYQTEGGVACVRFDLTVTGPDHVLRVNDLERVKGFPIPGRGDESRWERR
jgi:hypothetical protein